MGTSRPAYDDTFGFSVTPSEPRTHEELLEGLHDMLKNKGWTEMAENVKRYTDDRSKYLHLYADHYVNITEEGIRFTTEKDDCRGFGMFLQVGKEGDTTPTYAFSC